VLWILLAGSKWLFVGETLAEGGAITTPEAFQAGTVSYAHLMRNGKIKRFGATIGTVADITVLGTAEIETPENVDALFHLLTDPSWESPEE
jgi:hypothetical protein